MIPTYVLLPSITLLCFVGIYGISHSTFDIFMMVGVGLVGYLLRKVGIPLVPVILAVLLGPEMEVNLRRALSLSDGDFGILFGSSLAIVLWVLIVLVLALPFMWGLWRQGTREGEGAADPGAMRKGW